MTELAPGDVIIDPQGQEHTVIALAPCVCDEDGDLGTKITVEHGWYIDDRRFREDREIYPVGAPDTIIFRVKA